jgi:hypothetical protein
VLQSSSSCKPASGDVWFSPPLDANDANTDAGRDFVCPNARGVRRRGFIRREQARSLAVITDVLCVGAESGLPPSGRLSHSSTVGSVRTRFLSDDTGMEELNWE